jgi:prepilin-type N-terminal cleavage/methylation domain-containing protein
MKRGKGFTVIELLIVIAVIAILAVVIVLGMRNAQANAKLGRVSSELTMLANAVTQYAEDNFYQYPADVSRGMPPGLERYVQGGVWPTGPWPQGVYDWDNWDISSQKVYQMTYRLCDTSDPESTCRDPIIFPNFVRNSSVFYCIHGSCLPHESSPTVPAYCVNCSDKTVNY